MTNTSTSVPFERRATGRVQVAKRRFVSLLPWFAVLVPIVAGLELLAHARQATRRITPDQWASARDEVRAHLRPNDLVLFAPRWIDPVGRLHFGDDVITVERAAYPDLTRFARVVQVSAYGQHRAEIDGWRDVQHRDFGAITVGIFENPAYEPVLDDLVSLVGPERLEVTMSGAAAGCAWKTEAPRTGPLGFGPALPAARFHCPRGLWVGSTVLPSLDYSPRRCIYAPPPGPGTSLRLLFRTVRFGNTLVGHHGLYVEAERDRLGTPATIEFRTASTLIGRAVHNDGDGWDGFRFDTPSLAGQSGDIVVEISSANANRRMYCFEATTR